MDLSNDKQKPLEAGISGNSGNFSLAWANDSGPIKKEKVWEMNRIRQKLHTVRKNAIFLRSEFSHQNLKFKHENSIWSE